ncbi:MAG: HEAT repeat domain-containing protein, partial [Candidatus Omnitrophica bacterium]|nr:HEAT repeat domain-containing protein [Candidatus Omnitrophota bacterium]
TTEVHYSENKAPTKTIYINPHDPLRSELAVEVPKGENGEKDFVINRWWEIDTDTADAPFGVVQGSVAVNEEGIVGEVSNLEGQDADGNFIYSVDNDEKRRLKYRCFELSGLLDYEEYISPEEPKISRLYFDYRGDPLYRVKITDAKISLLNDYGVIHYGDGYTLAWEIDKREYKGNIAKGVHSIDKSIKGVPYTVIDKYGYPVLWHDDRYIERKGYDDEFHPWFNYLRNNPIIGPMREKQSFPGANEEENKKIEELINKDTETQGESALAEGKDVDKDVISFDWKKTILYGGGAISVWLVSFLVLPMSFAYRFRKWRVTNINKASSKTLQKRLKISPEVAEYIIEYRQNNPQGFESISELLKIEGITKEKFNEVKGKLIVGKARKPRMELLKIKRKRSPPQRVVQSEIDILASIFEDIVTKIEQNPDISPSQKDETIRSLQTKVFYQINSTINELLGKNLLTNLQLERVVKHYQNLLAGGQISPSLLANDMLMEIIDVAYRPHLEDYFEEIGYADMPEKEEIIQKEIQRLWRHSFVVKDYTRDTSQMAEDDLWIKMRKPEGWVEVPLRDYTYLLIIQMATRQLGLSGRSSFTKRMVEKIHRLQSQGMQPTQIREELEKEFIFWNTILIDQLLKWEGIKDEKNREATPFILKNEDFDDLYKWWDDPVSEFGLQSFVDEIYQMHRGIENLDAQIKAINDQIRVALARGLATNNLEQQRANLKAQREAINSEGLWDGERKELASNIANEINNRVESRLKEKRKSEVKDKYAELKGVSGALRKFLIWALGLKGALARAQLPRAKGEINARTKIKATFNYYWLKSRLILLFVGEMLIDVCTPAKDVKSAKFKAKSAFWLGSLATGVVFNYWWLGKVIPTLSAMPEAPMIFGIATWPIAIIPLIGTALLAFVSIIHLTKGIWSWSERERMRMETVKDTYLNPYGRYDFKSKLKEINEYAPEELKEVVEDMYINKYLTYEEKEKYLRGEFSVPQNPDAAYMLKRFVNSFHRRDMVNDPETLAEIVPLTKVIATVGEMLYKPWEELLKNGEIVHLASSHKEEWQNMIDMILRSHRQGERIKTEREEVVIRFNSGVEADVFEKLRDNPRLLKNEEILDIIESTPELKKIIERWANLNCLDSVYRTVEGSLRTRQARENLIKRIHPDISDGELEKWVSRLDQTIWLRQNIGFRNNYDLEAAKEKYIKGLKDANIPINPQQIQDINKMDLVTFWQEVGNSGLSEDKKKEIFGNLELAKENYIKFLPSLTPEQIQSINGMDLVTFWQEVKSSQLPEDKKQKVMGVFFDLEAEYINRLNKDKKLVDFETIPCMPLYTRIHLAKYMAWASALPIARGEVIMSLDKDHDFRLSEVMREPNASRKFDLNPRLAIGPYRMYGDNKRLSLIAYVFGTGEEGWLTSEQQAKELADALEFYGKGLGAIDPLLNDQGLTDDFVAEDVETGMVEIDQGYETTHFEEFEVGQSQPPTYPDAMVPQGKYAADAPESQSWVTPMRFYLNPNVHPATRMGALFSFGHYDKKPFILATTLLFYLLSFVLFWNPFYATPAFLGVAIGILLSQAINIHGIRSYTLRHGYITGMLKFIYDFPKLAFVYISFIPIYCINLLKGLLRYAKFNITKTGATFEREDWRTIYDRKEIKFSVKLGAIMTSGFALSPFFLYEFGAWTFFIAMGFIFLSAAFFLNPSKDITKPAWGKIFEGTSLGIVLLAIFMSNLPLLLVSTTALIVSTIYGARSQTGAMYDVIRAFGTAWWDMTLGMIFRKPHRWTGFRIKPRRLIPILISVPLILLPFVHSALGQTAVEPTTQTSLISQLLISYPYIPAILILGLGIGLFFTIWRYMFPVSWYLWRLKSSNSDVRRTAAQALGEIGSLEAIPDLRNALGDLNSYVRKAAADALDELGWKSQNQEEKIIYLIAKQNWEVLAKIGPPAIEPLIKALKDSDLDICYSALQALVKIGQSAVEPLIEAYRNTSSTTIARALSEFGDPKTLPFLLKNANGSGPLWKDKHLEYAIDLINNINSLTSEETTYLLSLLNMNWYCWDSLCEVNKAVCKAFCRIKDHPLGLAINKLLATLEKQGMPTNYTLEEVVPTLLKVFGNRPEFFLALNLGEDLANLGIFPCDTLKWGVPIAWEQSEGNMERYKLNLQILEKASQQWRDWVKIKNIRWKDEGSSHGAYVDFLKQVIRPLMGVAENLRDTAKAIEICLSSVEIIKSSEGGYVDHMVTYCPESGVGSPTLDEYDVKIPLKEFDYLNFSKAKALIENIPQPAHFSTLKLRKGSSYKGRLSKNGLTNVNQIIASLRTEPLKLNIQDKQITFNIDRDLLTKLHLSDGEIAAFIKKALDKDKLDVST